MSTLSAGGDGASDSSDAYSCDFEVASDTGSMHGCDTTRHRAASVGSTATLGSFNTDVGDELDAMSMSSTATPAASDVGGDSGADDAELFTEDASSVVAETFRSLNTVADQLAALPGGAMGDSSLDEASHTLDHLDGNFPSTAGEEGDPESTAVLPHLPVLATTRGAWAPHPKASPVPHLRVSASTRKLGGAREPGAARSFADASVNTAEHGASLPWSPTPPSPPHCGLACILAIFSADWYHQHQTNLIN